MINNSINSQILHNPLGLTPRRADSRYLAGSRCVALVSLMRSILSRIIRMDIEISIELLWIYRPRMEANQQRAAYATQYVIPVSAVHSSVMRYAVYKKRA